MSTVKGQIRQIVTSWGAGIIIPIAAETEKCYFIHRQRRASRNDFAKQV